MRAARDLDDDIEDDEIAGATWKCPGNGIVQGWSEYERMSEP